MEFTFSEEQDTVRELAREILEKEVSTERVKDVLCSEHAQDDELWAKLAEANLLGIAIAEAQGGMGMGFLELCCLLEEVGRVVAPVPVLETLVLGALPIAAWGTDAQKSEWLPRIAAGKALLGAAILDADSAEITEPATMARPEGSGFILAGRKRFVSAASRADRILVPARISGESGGVAVFLVDPSADGVKLSGDRISTGALLFEMELSDVRVSAADQLGNGAATGAEILTWIHQHALVAISAIQVGVSDRALDITAGYTREREQFGVPIGTFQAVQHRAADCFIDVEALRWCTWRAAWKLADGQPAAREAAVAKYWASEAGSRVAKASVHLHGGIGSDVDYPIQRYFLWARALELQLGSASPQLAWLGRDLARRGMEKSA
ncbi:MAG: acyl-CoA/acyl-ACP dehydrogenase [bacterium]|nr:acyl-CoA/acyl-ACP dehydrogenase [bacterium]MCP5067154.1 acyl-CoA/acyl-ACP dehydrogenase [bacterium]